MKHVLKSLIMIFGVASLCHAATTQNVTVKANIPQMNSLSVTVSRITASNDDWNSATSMDFGTLNFDNVNHIFRSNYYYAIDVGANTNAANWTLTHTRSSITNGSANLNDKVNVSFVKQINDTTDIPLDKLSYQNSHNKSYSKANLSGGWLRIYYGLGTGLDDAPGVTPIGSDTPYGNYQGSVTLTLTIN